mgnify:FL=1
MVYLNYNNLDAETQNQLLQNSKSEVEQKIGDDLKAYSEKHHINYDTLLEEEAIK